VEIDSRKCVNLEFLKTIFYRNWSLDTCHPLFCQDWSIHDPAIGQNDVTALVIRVIFGGELLVCHRYSLEYFWNIIPCGQKIDLTVLENIKKVDVTGKSIGKGFQGTVKRWNFSRGPMAHGSKNHREPGSIGAGTTPGRVIKGKNMAGNMGNERVTVTKLQLVKIDSENSLILIKGSVPGPEGKLVTIKPSRTKWN